jgi:hypothetical protein
MKKDVLIFAMMTWEDFQCGVDNTNAHILRWFLKRQDVRKIFFVDFRQFDFTSKLKYFLKTKPFFKKRVSVFYRFSYGVDRVSDRLFRYAGFGGNLPKIVDSFNIQPEEVWSFNPLDSGFLRLFPKAKKIFYNIDDWRANHLFRSRTELLDKTYLLIKSEADFIFTPSAQLIGSLWSGSKKAFHINNAVDLEFFKTPEKTPRNKNQSGV